MRLLRVVAAVACSLAVATSAHAQALRYFGYVGNGETEEDLQRTASFTNFAYTVTHESNPDDPVLASRVSRMAAHGVQAIINLRVLWCGSGPFHLCTAADGLDYAERWRRWKVANASILTPGHILAFAILDEPYTKLASMDEFDTAADLVKNDWELRQKDPSGQWPKLLMVEAACVVRGNCGTPINDFATKGGRLTSVDWIGVDEYAIHPMREPDRSNYDDALRLLTDRFPGKGIVYVMDGYWDAQGNDGNHPGRLGSIDAMEGVTWEWYQRASADPAAVVLGVFIWSAYQVSSGYCGADGTCFPCAANAAQARIGRLITGRGRSYTPIGYMDGIDGNGCVWGWACDPDAAFACETSNVSFYAESLGWVASARADLGSEPAVNSQCRVGTAHRFRTCLPASTEGKRVWTYAEDLTGGLYNIPSYSCPEAPACTWRSEGVCTASPPVGPWNGNAYNAGYYDYLCGYYKYAYGYDPYGYCAAAVAASNAAGTHTAGTGDCPNGPVYNYYAGLYDYYCRYYEYIGYGWDYGSYCYWSSYYASAGRCERCGTASTPSCQATARTIWIQPQWRAGFGPPGSLVLAGSASTTGVCSSAGVDLYWRTPSMWNWEHAPYAAPPDAGGIWYNAIENADPFGTYYTYVTYHGGPAYYCTYDGRNDIVWCP